MYAGFPEALFCYQAYAGNMRKCICEHVELYHLSWAIPKFAWDARRRACRRTLVLQVPDNAADQAKSGIPKGFKSWGNLKIWLESESTQWFMAIKSKISINYLKLFTKKFSPGFETLNTVWRNVMRTGIYPFFHEGYFRKTNNPKTWRTANLV